MFCYANGNSLLLQTTNGGDINIYGTQNGASDTIIAGGAFTSQSALPILALNALQAGSQHQHRR